MTTAPPDVPVFARAAAALKAQAGQNYRQCEHSGSWITMNAIDVQRGDDYDLCPRCFHANKSCCTELEQNPGSLLCSNRGFKQSPRLRRHHRIRLYPG